MIKLNLGLLQCELSRDTVKIKNEKYTQYIVTCLCVVMNIISLNVHLLQMQVHQRPENHGRMANRTMHNTGLATVINFLTLFI
jgi:hypothetical protein